MSDSISDEQRAERVRSAGGAEADLLLSLPAGARVGLLWIPALGVPARHYQPFAEALASRGIAVARHEWRGIGSSSLRASRSNDWSYRELIGDVADSLEAARTAAPSVQWLVGGHSLGSQFAAMAFALHSQSIAGLVVIAGGMPYWKNFPGVNAIGIRALFALAPVIARWRGHFPGRRFGFAGNEARGVMRDWALTGRSGSYSIATPDGDIDTAMAGQSGPVLGIWLDEDWFTPRPSFDHLLEKLASADITMRQLTQADF
ncbi:MAG: alpha/beta fold hydrolase, partial [Dokdonella sp.]